MQSQNLIQSLIATSQQVINDAEKLKGKDLQSLTWRADDGSWNILECLEHLNLYSQFYLPQLESSIKNSKTTSESDFRSGMMGSYFAKSMLPNERLKKMKTFKSKNPLNAKLQKNVIDDFINHQIKFINLLRQSDTVSLNKVKVATSLSAWIKLSLGDTFQFIVNHNLRHFQQIERVTATMLQHREIKPPNAQVRVP